MIDVTIAKLKSYDTEEAERAKSDTALMQELVNRYFHCG